MRQLAAAGAGAGHGPRALLGAVVLVGLLVGLSAAKPLRSQDCSGPRRVNVDIRTGVDADADDLWLVRRGSQQEFEPARVRSVGSCRGDRSLDPQPFGDGRYPVPPDL